MRTFALPGKDDDALVLSIMFIWARGPLLVHCDLMKEDGPVILDMGSNDLGPSPSASAIDAATDAVVDFVAGLGEVIVSSLTTQLR